MHEKICDLSVYLEGSRVNPSVLQDIFQDYDIVYVVDTTDSYRNHRGWIQQFGEIMYMNYPSD